jgi:antirestriction protein ArdC
MKSDATSTSRQDVYTRITSQIVASLEQGMLNMLPDASRSRCVSTSSPIPVLTSSRSG